MIKIRKIILFNEIIDPIDEIEAIAIHFFLFLFPFFFALARVWHESRFSLRASINRIRFRRSPSRKKGSIYFTSKVDHGSKTHRVFYIA